MDEIVQDQTPAEAPSAPAPGEAAPTAAPAANGKAPVGDITQAEGDGVAPTSTWPEDWRERWAGKDEKFLGVLKRYTSPENVAKAYGSLRQQLHNGELIKKLPADASDEQTAQWREHMGLPANAEGYKLPAIGGHEWTEADKPMVTEFLGKAHAANLNQGQVDGVLNWYVEQQRLVEENRHQVDTQSRMQLEDKLRLEWGPEFRGNVGLSKRVLESFPNGLGQKLIDARFADGTRLIDDVDFISDLAERGRATYGDASFVSGDGMANLSNREKEIENIMHTDPNRYRREKLDVELLDIYRKKEKFKK